MTRTKRTVKRIKISEILAEQCLEDGIFNVNKLLEVTGNSGNTKAYQIRKDRIDLSFLSLQLQIRVVQYIGQFADVKSTLYDPHILGTMRVLRSLPIDAYTGSVAMIKALYKATLSTAVDTSLKNALLTFNITKDAENIQTEEQFIEYTVNTGLIIPHIAGKVVGNKKMQGSFDPAHNSGSKNCMRIDNWGDNVRIVFAKTLLNDAKVERCNNHTFRNHYRHINDYAKMFSEEARNDTEALFKELPAFLKNNTSTDVNTDIFGVILFTLLDEQKEKYGIMNVDMWMFKWLDPSRARLNRDMERNMFNFTKIENPHNKQVAKDYCMYLIEMSDRAYGTIAIINEKIVRLSSIIDCDFEQLTTKGADKFIQKISMDYAQKRNNDPIAINNYIMPFIDTYLRFYEWLEAYKRVSSNPFALAKTQVRYIKKPLRKTNITPYLIQQLFECLPFLKDRRLIFNFLVVFETGMRISEACQLRKKDLRIQGATDKDGNFVVKCGELHYYSTKMRKSCVTYISPHLTMLLHSYIMTSRKNTDWLFPVDEKRDKPMRSNQVTRRMRDWVKENDIRTDDGTPYNFKEHDFRHFMAKRMKEKKLTIAEIQAQLSHKNIDMTLRYLDDTEATRMLKDKQFFDVHGNSSNADKELDEAIDSLANVHDKLTTIFLPNGLCARSNRLHSCPHSCACINNNCSHFRTNVEYLPVHRKQLNAEQQMLQECIKGGYLAEAETHKTNIEHLQNLINRLEGTSNAPDSATANIEVTTNTEVTHGYN